MPPEENPTDPTEESPPDPQGSVDPSKEPVTEPPANPSPDTATAVDVLQKQVDDLKAENVAVKQQNKEEVEKLLKTVMTPAPAPAEPVPDPSDDEYLTDPKKASEAALLSMYEKKVAPQQANTSSRLFSIDYRMVESGEDAEAFKKLKPDIDKYFTENPQAAHVPNALQTIFTHFKGVHFSRLHTELNEAAEAAESNPPPSPSTPSSKNKAPTLTKEEKRFAIGVGLSEEEMLESKKELLG